MTAIAPPLTGSYFESDIPDAGLKIQLNQDVIGRLAAAVMEGFKMVPRRGLEVGGLLLGHTEPGCVIVDEFEPIESEHQRGPSWLLSDKDRQQLAEAASGANDPAKDTRVVGLYRSQTRAGFAPSEEDIALMHELCPEGECVFLLVKPEGIGRSSALFAAGDGLKKFSEVFPFRGKVSAPVQPLRAETPRAPTPEAQPTARIHEAAPPELDRVHRLDTARVMEGFNADKELQPVEPARTPGTSSLVAQIACTLAILVCASIAGYVAAKWWTASPQAETLPASPSPASMALHATWAGSSLRLDWDRNSATVRNASGGVLWIDDGAQHRRLDMAVDDLTQGSIQYWPSSNDVSFRLAVFTPKATMSESVRALSVPVPSRAPAQEPRPPSPPPVTTAAKAPAQKSRRAADSRRSAETRHRGSASRQALK
jgi:hypothetical protein